MEKSEEKLRLMLKNSSDTYVLVNEKGEQFYVSDAAVRATGFSLDELLGPIQNVIYPEDIDIVLKAWNEVLTKKDEVIRVQYRHKHKTKEYIWYEAVGQNFLDNPLINAVVVNVRDITTMKEFETELITAKEKAEESDRLKSVFIHNLSHEIKTPLNGIVGFTDLLSNNPIDKEENAAYIEIIRNCTKQLERIINDILEISRLDTKQVHVIEELTNLNNLISDQYYILLLS